MNGINFNTSPPINFNPFFREYYHNTGEFATTSASISDCSGNLLFYASPCQVWNRNQQFMPNGTLVGDCNSIFPCQVYSTQTVVHIIPKPGDNLKYYVIESIDPLWCYYHNSYNGIYYSEVDMNLQNGLGDIDSIKNIRIDSFATSAMTIIPASNNHDYWLVTKPSNTQFYAFKVTDSGISKTPIISNGLGDCLNGKMKSSHDYSQLVTTGISTGQSIYSSYLFNFNRSTGKITNPKPILRHGLHPGAITLGIEFSPNDSLIYLSTDISNKKLFQIERFASIQWLTADSIPITTLNEIAGLQIGPDNKIYTNEVYKIGVIQNPNIKGTGCSYSPVGVILNYAIATGETFPTLYFPKYKPKFKKVSEPNNCFTDSARFINLSDTIFISYIWYFGDGDSLIVPDKRPVKHKYVNEGKYYVELIGKLHNTNYCTTEGVYGDTITVNYKPKVKISLDSLQIKCQKQILFLKDSTVGRLRSEWYWGDSSNIDTVYFVSHLFDTSGIYNIKLTSFNENCSDTDSIQVHITINTMPVADFIISDSVECFNNNLFQLTNTSSGKGNLKYLWQFGDGDTSTLFDILHSYLTPDTFNIMLVCSSDSVCRDTAVKRVIVNASPRAAFSVSDSVQCFIDNYFTLVNSSTIIEGKISFFWDFGNNVTSKVFETSIHYDSTRNYNVRLVATSGFGCTDTNNILMQVKPEPVAAFTIDDSMQCLAGNKFSFTNNSTILNDTFSSYWNFGDDTISAIASPVYSYMDTGKYKVTLITISTYGCKDTISKKVAIYPDPSVLSVSGEDHCGTGKVYLSAKAENGTINWYLWDAGGTLLYQGDSFFTNSGATYYVEAVNPGCASSPRTPITTTVKYIPKIISTTPASNLLPSSITLRAYPDYGTVNWYDTSVGGVLLANGTSFTTPFLDSSKTYYVDATYLDCTTLTRTGIKATIGINSINEPFNKVEVIFYPNPVTDILVVEVNNLNENAILTFVDVQGKIVKTVNLNPVNLKIYCQIDLHDISQGMYLLNLRNDSIFKSGRLVKF